MSSPLTIDRGVLHLVTAVCAVTGACSRTHTYTLPDVEAITLGRSARAEVEREFRVADGTRTRTEEDGAVTYRSTAVRWRPAFPLVVLTFPVYSDKVEDLVEITAWYDEHGTLKRGRIVAGRFRMYSLLLLAHPHGWDPDYPVEIEPGSLATLRRLRDRGWEVLFRVSYGPTDVPLEEAR